MSQRTVQPLAGDTVRMLYPGLVTQKLFCPDWNVAVKIGDFDPEHEVSTNSNALLCWVTVRIFSFFFLIFFKFLKSISSDRYYY